MIQLGPFSLKLKAEKERKDEDRGYPGSLLLGSYLCHFG